MSAGARSQVNPYRLYVFGLGFGGSLLMAIVNTTSAVYWVTSGHLNALELLLLGTALEITYFTFQLPTGVLADLVSRRLCVIVGWFTTGAAFVLQGLSPAYPNLLAAQVIFGVGVALTIGAEEAWIADELGDVEMTSVYVRATQYGLVADLIGALASGGLAYLGLNVPMLVGGGGMIGLAAFLLATMPEKNFRADAHASIATIVRGARGTLATQTRATRRAIVAVPGLVLLFAMTAFVGAWSESFDRLWGAFLIREITSPHVYGLRPALWFSLIACMVALISLGSTELARRRTERLGPSSVVGTLLAVTVLIGIGSVLFASGRLFVVAIAAYLLIEILRPVSGPLLSGWIGRASRPGRTGHGAVGAGTVRRGRPDRRWSQCRRDRSARVDTGRALRRCGRSGARRRPARRSDTSLARTSRIRRRSAGGRCGAGTLRVRATQPGRGRTGNVRFLTRGSSQLGWVVRKQPLNPAMRRAVRRPRPYATSRRACGGCSRRGRPRSSARYRDAARVPHSSGRRRRVVRPHVRAGSMPPDR